MRPTRQTLTAAVLALVLSFPAASEAAVQNPGEFKFVFDTGFIKVGSVSGSMSDGVVVDAAVASDGTLSNIRLDFPPQPMHTFGAEAYFELQPGASGRIDPESGDAALTLPLGVTIWADHTRNCLTSAIVQLHTAPERGWSRYDKDTGRLALGDDSFAVPAARAVGSQPQFCDQVNAGVPLPSGSGSNELVLRGEVTPRILGGSGPPDTRIDAGPEPGSYVGQAANFSYSGVPASAVARFECAFDSDAFAQCGYGRQTYLFQAPSLDGPHTVSIRAVDFDGRPDPTPASRSFIVDNTPPSVEITAGPTGSIEETRPRFELSADDVNGIRTIECSIAPPGNPLFGECAGAGHHMPAGALTDGDYVFSVRAVDNAGHEGAAARSFTVRIAPDTRILSGPADGSLTGAGSATFTYEGDPAADTERFECSLDAAGFTACPAGGTSYDGLGDGQHTFEVRAVDAQGNADETPASRTWTVDATPPETRIDSGPEGQVEEGSHTFTFSASEEGSTFECSLDTGTPSWARCESGDGFGPLSSGLYTFRVRAGDALGNVDPTPAERELTVVPPPNTKKVRRIIGTGTIRGLNGGDATITFDVSLGLLGYTGTIVTRDPGANFLIRSSMPLIGGRVWRFGVNGAAGTALLADGRTPQPWAVDDLDALRLGPDWVRIDAPAYKNSGRLTSGDIAVLPL